MPTNRASWGLCEIIQSMYDIDVSQRTIHKKHVPSHHTHFFQLIKLIYGLYDGLVEIPGNCMILMVAEAEKSSILTQLSPVPCCTPK